MLKNNYCTLEDELNKAPRGGFILLPITIGDQFFKNLR